MRSSSSFESLEGSQITPPLAPPNGILTTAHFQVIQAANCAHFVQRDIGREANAAFARAAHDDVQRDNQ